MDSKTKHASSDCQQSEPLKCPRCSSTNTKFCYYNNYNKSQPRHFCKSCKRHWTKGGTLRSIPVGGRKNKRLNIPTTSAMMSGQQKYKSLAPSNANTQSTVFSSLTTLDTSSINPTSYRSLDDHVDYYHPDGFIDESSISSGTRLGPDTMDWPNYWNWSETDHVLTNTYELSTTWDDVFAEISNSKI